MIGEEAAGVMRTRAMDDAAHPGHAFSHRHAAARLRCGPSRMQRQRADAARRKIEHEVREWLSRAGLVEAAASLVVRVVERQKEKARA